MPRPLAVLLVGLLSLTPLAAAIVRHRRHGYLHH